MTRPDHIIHSTNGRTYDLTALETPLALLPDDVSDALREWPHGLQRLHCSGEWKIADTIWSAEFTYRAKPAPKVTEHVLYWHEDHAALLLRGPYHTHKITLRYNTPDPFDTLPAGTYTGPDGAVIVVEALK